MGMFKKLLLVHVYSGLKYKFCENINKIGLVAYMSALGSLNDNNNFIKTDIFKPILKCSGVLKIDIFVEGSK